MGRPSFVIGLNEKSVINKCQVNVLAKEEADTRSVGSEILEEDFEFKPSFGHQLKAMGSVKLREENPRHDVRSRDVSRRQLSEASQERVKPGEYERHWDHGNVSKVTKGTVKQSRMQEVRGFSDEYDSRRRYEDEKEMRKVKGDTRDEKWSRYTGGLEQEVKYKSGETESARNGKENLRDYKSTGKHFDSRKSDVRSEDGLERYRFKATDDKAFSSRSGNLTKSTREHPRNDHDERAAFKNFDEFTDNVAKPRVSQMQMDERI